ncbi:hypothetical protein, partial [Elizabethkingia meningoseptica]|uniref:hypothetical protein n=1 Tax=Elizabethkingia meningoseptica TaxID=238 RepID=UPI0023B06414
SVDCIAGKLLLSIAYFLFQSTLKYYELFLSKTPTIFDHITIFKNLSAMEKSIHVPVPTRNMMFDFS